MTVSAFGVDHGDISKARKKHDTSGAAIAGAGATASGVGLAAGGIPGARPNGNAVFAMKHGEGKGVRRVVSEVRGKAPALKATPGGVLGFRRSIHDLGTKFFKEKARIDSAKAKPTESATKAFFRAHNEGKIAPEEAIMRGMKVGRVASHGVLAGGVAATAYGVKRMNTPKKPIKKSDRTKRYNGALLGAGTTTAASAHYGSNYLKGQEQKYATKAASRIDEGAKLVPSTGGRHGVQMNLRQMDKYKRKYPGAEFPKTMHPVVSDSEVARHHLKNVPNDVAAKLGHLRGAAAQERHFSEVFGNSAKAVRAARTPGAIVGAVGAGGLIASRERSKKK